MQSYPDIQRRDGVLFFACGDNDRTAIATSIERLIDLLDELDGDCDLEDSADGEPSLGWPAGTGRYPQNYDLEPTRLYLSQFTTWKGEIDLECDEEDLEDDGTAEPWLGSPEVYITAGYGVNGREYRDHQGNQVLWARGGTSDREEENEHGGDILDVPHDDSPPSDGEPSLGFTEALDQSPGNGFWGEVTYTDLEAAPEETPTDGVTHQPPLHVRASMVEPGSLFLRISN